MAGRGRGRGRSKPLDGDETPTVPGLAARKDDHDDRCDVPAVSNGATKTDDQPRLSLSDIKTIIEDARTYHPGSDVKKVLMLARHFVKEEEDVKTLASLIYNRCLTDSTIAKRGSEICDCLTSIECGKAMFRNSLLSLVQADFKARNELFALKPMRYKAFLSFLCEIFSVMRTASNEVFKPLVGPIFDCFELIIDPESTGEGGGDLDTEDVHEVFTEQLPNVGKLIQEYDDEDRMTQLLNKIRLAIIHSQSSPRVRCALLEVLESSSRGWEPSDSETARWYCDTAVDIISGLTLS